MVKGFVDIMVGLFMTVIGLLVSDMEEAYTHILTGTLIKVLNVTIQEIIIFLVII